MSEARGVFNSFEIELPRELQDVGGGPARYSTVGRWGVNSIFKSVTSFNI